MVRKKREPSKEYERFLEKCRWVESKIISIYPDMDPHDLHLIVRNVLMPRKWGRRFLLRKIKGRYVP